MMKKISFLMVAIISAALMVLPGNHFPSASASQAGIINNSDLMPKYVPDSEVKVNEFGTPEWIQSLIMTEVRLRTCTPEGTFASAVKMLDHYQEMGVNGLWITPINDPNPENGNGYGNMGPHTIDLSLSGTDTYEEGWTEFKKFVDEAHKRNIRIVLDVISWGTLKEAPLYQEHPEWYTGKEEWGGWAFNWENETFKEWYINELVDIAVETGIDGFRYDVEPHYAGYAVHEEVRSRLLAKGRKLLMMAEHENERGMAYDLGQFDLLYTKENLEILNPPFVFLDKFNLVDSIKNGENIGSKFSQEIGDGGGYQYYVHTLNCHDNYGSVVRGNRLAIGYQAIYAPFIPMWYIGEEWNNFPNEKAEVQYFSAIDWDKLNQPENRAFYEDVKAMIRVRRENPEIFEYYPEIHRDSNICKVNVAGCEAIQPYARYAGDTAILVVPNYNVHDKSGKMTVYMPFEDTGLKGYKNYTVTNAITGQTVVSGSAAKVAKFDVTVPYEDMLVLKVQASGKPVQPDDPVSPGTSSGTEASDPQPSETQPSQTEPSETQPSETQPSQTEPSQTEPSETQPSKNQPSETEPSHTQVMGKTNGKTTVIWLASVGGVLLLGIGITLVVLKLKKGRA